MVKAGKENAQLLEYKINHDIMEAKPFNRN